MMRAGNLRAGLRAAAFFGVTGLLTVTYPLAVALGTPARYRVRRFWSRFTCWLLRIRVSASGAPFGACPTLLVANHVSYLDVVILGSFTDALFIAKSEVDGWPVFGFIARVTGTMFIKRHWRQALAQRDAMAERMRQGQSLVLFAEGTSSNGLGVKPFKSSLLSVAEPWVMDRPVAAQAVTVAYRRLADGTPFGPANCDLYAWYDTMSFGPHLWQALKLPGLEVEVEFGEPVMSWQVASRKPLARAMQAGIAARLAELRGRGAATAAAVGDMPTGPGLAGAAGPEVAGGGDWSGVGAR